MQVLYLKSNFCQMVQNYFISLLENDKDRIAEPYQTTRYMGPLCRCRGRYRTEAAHVSAASVAAGVLTSATRPPRRVSATPARDSTVSAPPQVNNGGRGPGRPQREPLVTE